MTPDAGARSGRAVRIGLTGPIGCGKSTIAGWLAERPDVAVVDADRLAREVLEPGSPAYSAVVARFGPDVVATDGTLDRAALGRIVFADAARLAELEAIVHPDVRPRLDGAVRQAEAAGARAIVIEAIKLVEGGYAATCDEVWLVTCQPDEQRRRLLGRGLDPADAARRVAAQGDIRERVAAVAHRTIEADGAPELVRQRVEAALAAAFAARPVARPPSEGARSPGG